MDKNNLIRDSFSPLISVIIPIYNNTPFDIRRCIDSILMQRFESYEVIMVDDGSRKDCADFIDEIANKRHNFIVIHQSNQGVSVARNVGVNSASGEFIIFVDADDLITPQFFLDVYYITNQYSVDIIYGFVKYIKNNNRFANLNNSTEKLIIEYLDISMKCALYQYMIDYSVDYFRDKDLYVNLGPVAKVIRREIAKKNLFNNNLSYGEDAIWNLNLLSRASDLEIIYAKRLWYLYTENLDSVTHKYVDNTIKKCERFLLVLWQYSNSERFKINFLNRELQVIGQIWHAHFLTKKRKKTIDELNLTQLVKTEPWNFAFKWRYAVHLNKKSLFKFLLLKLGILSFVYRFKNIF